MVWLASAAQAELTNGGYYTKRKLTEPTSATRSPELAAALWTASESALALQ